jgi:hypothetical protein
MEKPVADPFDIRPDAAGFLACVRAACEALQ